MSKYNTSTTIAAAVVLAAVATTTARAQTTIFSRPAITYCIRDNADPSISASAYASVHTVNSQIEIYDGSQMQTRTRQWLDIDPSLSGQPTFFGPVGGQRIVDTKTIFDQYNGRFIVLSLQHPGATAPNAPYGIFLAASQNDNPPDLTSWRKFQMLTPNITIGNTTVTPDYNGLGLDQTRLIYTGNLADTSLSPPPILGHLYRIFTLSSIYTGGAPQFTDIVIPNRGAAELPQPAHSFGPASTLYLVGLDAAPNSLRITAIDAAGVRCERVVTVPAFLRPGTFGVGVPQAGTSVQLEPLDGRIMNAVVRDGRLFTCHAVVANGKHVARWYEFDLGGWPANGCLNGGPNLVQTGTIDPGNNAAGNPVHTFYPAIMVDRFRNVGLVFARGAANEVASIQVAGRLRTDPLGQLRAPSSVGVPGIGAMTVPSSNGTARWGDYFGIALSPFDERTMYVAGTAPWPSGVTSYCNPVSGVIWRTSVGRFKVFDTGSITQFGAGTPGLAGTVPFYMSMGTSATIGSTLDLRVQNVTQLGAGAGVLRMIGFSPAPTPIPLLNGFLLLDPTAISNSFYVFPDAVEAQVPLSVPYDGNLIGLNVFSQCIEGGIDPDIAFTAGLQIRLGVL